MYRNLKRMVDICMPADLAKIRQDKIEGTAGCSSMEFGYFRKLCTALRC
jgi:hypothetical protein